MLNKQFFDFTIFPIQAPETLLAAAKGENKKGLLLLYLQEADEAIHLELLQNILQAIKYDLYQDATLLKLTPESCCRFIDIAKLIEINDVLVFGLQPKQIGLHWQVKAYEVIQQMDKRFLFAHPLSQIQDDKQKKSALWQQLKTLFLDK